jgi:cyclic dehypoxanthinyl futalosine synthase
MHPRLGIEFYERLFQQLKKEYPQVRLNALGAPEVAHIAHLSNLSTMETLKRLRAAGLDTLPGAGAEILSEQVRKRISPAKPSAHDWVRVMHEAHILDIPTTATMMYGHIEQPHQRIDHLITLRDLQAAKPASSRGFTAFIPWIFCPKGTQLEREGVAPRFSATEYLRIIAMSRIILHNIQNIQASWLTVGKEVAELALKSGANDMGSIMIEENVVSSAGATTRFDREAMQATIRRAGFTPRLRDQLYNYRD